MVCAIDGESLTVRKKITGVWRGVYGYAETKQLASRMPVPFTFKLKQGWTAHFTGSVTEDAPHGTPGVGAVDGYFKFPTVEFKKQMPVGYVAKLDGSRVTLREYFIAQGHPCDRDLPSSSIFYQGTFLDSSRIQGIWIIDPGKISLPGGASFPVRRNTGYWCVEFVTSDASANPTGGPKLAPSLTNPCFQHKVNWRMWKESHPAQSREIQCDGRRKVPRSVRSREHPF